MQLAYIFSRVGTPVPGGSHEEKRQDTKLRFARGTVVRCYTCHVKVTYLQSLRQLRHGQCYAGGEWCSIKGNVRKWHTVQGHAGQLADRGIFAAASVNKERVAGLIRHHVLDLQTRSLEWNDGFHRRPIVQVNSHEGTLTGRSAAESNVDLSTLPGCHR